RLSSMPRRISATTITLVPISSTGVRVTQRATLGLARPRLRISEMMFVSSTNFTGQLAPISIGVVGQRRLRMPHLEARIRTRRRQSWSLDGLTRSPAPSELPWLFAAWRAAFRQRSDKAGILLVRLDLNAR